MSLKTSEKLLRSMKKETDYLINKYEDKIKAIWIITPEEILSNDDLTITILINDHLADKTDIKRIEADCTAKEENIRKKANVKIHSGFYILSEYFEKVMKGEIHIFREINTSIPIYDPTGFFVPLKKLIKVGGIPGSNIALKNLKESVNRRFKNINKLKVEIIEKLSLAVINAGQAPLVAENRSIPFPHVVDKKLIDWFVKNKKLPKHYVDDIKYVFEYYKSVEHGRTKKIEGKNLDKLFKKSLNVFDKMEDLVSDLTKGG